MNECIKSPESEIKLLKNENEKLNQQLDKQLNRTNDLINSVKYYQKQELELTIDRIYKFVDKSLQILIDEINNKFN